MLDIPIIFEDKDLLVLNKPTGLSMHHDDRGEPAYTLVEWLMEHYPEIKNVGESFDQPSPKSEKPKAGHFRPGLIHRLDRDTSGVLLVAKNQPTFLYLKEQFKNHLAQKTYRAILVGEMKVEIGAKQTIDLPIGRSNHDPRQRVASRKASGPLREALTDYTVLKTASGHTYVEASPKTGRTHQLRVHFKALNYPLLCDQLYAPKTHCSPEMGRQALHAFSLAISLANGESVCFQAPLPADFQNTLDKLGLV